jgi:exopolysaccharide biosynthesis polyprenyl glycosylphosphotransferase
MSGILATSAGARAVVEPRGLQTLPAEGSRDRSIRALLMLSDTLGVIAGMVALGVASQRPGTTGAILLGLATLPLWLLIFRAYGLYRRDQTRMGHTTVDDIPWLFHALLLGCPLMWVYFRLLPGDYHFGKIVVFGLVCAPSVLLARGGARVFGRQLIAPERLLLVGDRSDAELWEGRLRRHRGYPVTPVGWLAPTESEEAEAHDQVSALPLLGHCSPGHLAQVAREQRIDRVVLSDRQVGHTTLLDLVRECRKLSVKVSVVPGVSDAMGRAVEVDDVGGLTLLAITPPLLSRSARALKRGMDVVVALVLLAFSAPALAVIALAVGLDSPGPVLFRQKRVGRRGREFSMLKFRTMVQDADSRRAELFAASSETQWLHLEHDPRVTRVGRLLRQSSLDELPQLWNVLRGEMSLVGPRPLIASEDRNLIGWTRTRLDLTPGLSGLWQVVGRTEIPFEEMVKLDYLYVTNWSLWGDIRLMLKTVPAVLSRRGVN